jgi:hypothetical protein
MLTREYSFPNIICEKGKTAMSIKKSDIRQIDSWYFGNMGRTSFHTDVGKEKKNTKAPIQFDIWSMFQNTGDHYSFLVPDRVRS